MSQTIRSDIAIIGGGSAGLSFASGAAQLGAKVVLVEGHKMGGDCLNYGCVPSKSLLAAARSFYHVKEASYFGVEAKKLDINFSKVMAHVHAVIDKISEHDSVERFESLGVTVIKEKAEFQDTQTLKAGDFLIEAKYFVVATGSSPFVPPIDGLDSVPYKTNETIFDLKSQPSHLIVIGGGPIGCELGQAFAMLGSEVTILEAETILPHDDASCVEIVRNQFEKMKITLHEKSKVIKVHQNNDEIQVMIEKEGGEMKVTGSHLFVATGRRPNVKDLNLEKVNVKYSTKGIEVDERLRTKNKKVYAIGDVIGAYQFTHIANYHAGIVLRNILFWLPAKVDYHAIPWVTYTTPELAHAGISAKEASGRDDVQTTEFTFADNDRAQAEHATIGRIKAIITKKGKILGVTIVGKNAGELLLPWVMAIREKKSLRTFADAIAPYPTLSEVSKQVAGEFYKPKLFSKWVNRVVHWLLKLG
ncbi:dihydrolipoyl dehydrogenase family protein [Legionella yabuuchiae]|uniref:dihydrolipoyl dehydrogenase family protein n=1 Tax=Legionella yabuuchiae TaxID=376727 RepID=UPI001F5EC026|nr:FAD-dependent oxidoreductase [Legionella yabuuchiae]